MKDIKAFIAQLKRKISVKSVYLFGSYVRGANKDFSDIDLAIISDDFKGCKLIDIENITNITQNINRMIEPHPFRSEDFTEDDPLVKEIITTGIKVA